MPLSLLDGDEVPGTSAAVFLPGVTYNFGEYSGLLNSIVSIIRDVHGSTNPTQIVTRFGAQINCPNLMQAPGFGPKS